MSSWGRSTAIKIGLGGLLNREFKEWSKDNEKHAYGKYSYAVADGDEKEEFSQIDIAQDVTFFAIHDGHGGAGAARFVSDRFLRYLLGMGPRRMNGWVTEDNIRRVFTLLDDEFNVMAQQRPELFSTGSSSLIGIISQNNLYFGHLGNCKAVLGQEVVSKGPITGKGKAKSLISAITKSFTSTKMIAVPLVTEHNVNIPDEKQRIVAAHNNDSQIVIFNEEIEKWRIRDSSEITQSIGDIYLKIPGFDGGIVNPISSPIVSCRPDVRRRFLEPQDKFVVFGSSGFWKHVTDQEAVDIADSKFKHDAARKLMKKALKRSIEKRKKMIDDKTGQQFVIKEKYFEDITVIIVYFDPEWLMFNKKRKVKDICVKGGQWPPQETILKSETSGSNVVGETSGSNVVGPSGTNVESSGGGKSGDGKPSSSDAGGANQ